MSSNTATSFSFNFANHKSAWREPATTVIFSIGSPTDDVVYILTTTATVVYGNVANISVYPPAIRHHQLENVLLTALCADRLYGRR